MPVAMGTGSSDGILVSIHLERAPDVLEPDRLAVSVRIPLDAIRALTLPPEDYVVATGARQVSDEADSE
jgi:hypothetical protein